MKKEGSDIYKQQYFKRVEYEDKNNNETYKKNLKEN